MTRHCPKAPARNIANCIVLADTWISTSLQVQQGQSRGPVERAKLPRCHLSRLYLLQVMEQDVTNCWSDYSRFSVLSSWLSGHQCKAAYLFLHRNNHTFGVLVSVDPLYLQPNLFEHLPPLSLCSLRRSKHRHHGHVPRRGVETCTFIWQHVLVDEESAVTRFHGSNEMSEDDVAVGVGPVEKAIAYVIAFGACRFVISISR